MRVSIWTAVACAAVLGSLVGIFLPDRSPMVDYGTPKDTYLDPAEGLPGQVVKFCIDAGRWLDVPVPGSAWLLEATVYYDGRKPTATVHKIDEPGRVGPVPPKCRPGGKPRPFTLPSEPGPFHTTSTLFSQRRAWWAGIAWLWRGDGIIELRQAGPAVSGRVLRPAAADSK